MSNVSGSHPLTWQYPVTPDELEELDRRRDDFCNAIIERFGSKQSAENFPQTSGTGLQVTVMSMTVRAKFFVSAIEQYSSPSDSGSVKLVANNSKEGDNKDWSLYTPSGSVQMMITNPPAFEFFKQALKDKSAIYVDFSVVKQ